MPGPVPGQLWRRLREDRHSAELAAAHGWRDPAKLAGALRTLTQGRLSQHLFFHSLDRFAIPSEAPSIFGFPDSAFRELCHAARSPLEIGRARGRSPAWIQGLAAGPRRRG